MAVERHGELARIVRAGLALGLGGLSLAACATAPQRPNLATTTPPGGGNSELHGTDKPYQVGGVWYYPHAEPHYDAVGYASWYGQSFHNKRTADGEIFDQYALSAAHKTLPLPSIVEVTNLDNGRTMRLRLNDRGPFVDGRVLDVSKGAAEQLGFGQQGLARVRVRYLGPAPAFFTPVMYASTDPAVTSTRRVVLDEPIAGREGDMPTVDRKTQHPIASQSLAPLAPVPAQPAAPAADDTSRFVEPSVVLDAGGLAPTATAASTAQPADLTPPPRAVAMARLQEVPPQPAMASSQPITGGFVVQAGAFVSRANAERVAAQLGASAAIRPMDRAGVTLYRVVLAGYPSADAAQEGRARAIAAGFADARIIGAN